MAKLLKRYALIPGVPESLDGDLLLRSEVIAAIRRRIRTERERRPSYLSIGAIHALEALLARLGEKS